MVCFGSCDEIPRHANWFARILSPSHTHTHDFIHNFEHHCHRLCSAFLLTLNLSLSVRFSPAIIKSFWKVASLHTVCAVYRLLAFLLYNGIHIAHRTEPEPKNFKNLDYHLLFIGCWEFYFVRSLRRCSHSTMVSLSIVDFVSRFRLHIVYRKWCCFFRSVSYVVLWNGTERSAVQFADELNSIGRTVTQRKAFKIREHFGIWVKVESFQALCTSTFSHVSCSFLSLFHIIRFVIISVSRLHTYV